MEYADREIQIVFEGFCEPCDCSNYYYPDCRKGCEDFWREVELLHAEESESCQENMGNCALAKRACNNHYKLLEACKALCEAMSYDTPQTQAEAIDAAYDKAKSAISEAERNE